jgi:hypothetical protein
MNKELRAIIKKWFPKGNNDVLIRGLAVESYQLGQAAGGAGEWEKKFDKKFRQNTDSEKIGGWLKTDGVIFEGVQYEKIATPKDVKDFIRNLLRPGGLSEDGLEFDPKFTRERLENGAKQRFPEEIKCKECNDEVTYHTGHVDYNYLSKCICGKRYTETKEEYQSRLAQRHKLS